MSSVLRSVAIPKTSVTNVVTPNVMNYISETSYRPIPFIVKNGELDIHIQDDVAEKLTNPGVTIRRNDQSLQASVMGGLSLVSSLGPNMLSFLKNFIATQYSGSGSGAGSGATYNLVTNIEIYNKPTMTKLLFNDLYHEKTFELSDIAPVKITPDPIANDASAANNYRVVWIFKSPLVVSFKYDGGDTKYLTFVSAFDSQ